MRIQPEKLHIQAADTLPRPILLYVGRVAVEKNFRKFLDIDTVGSQIVVGDGPDLVSLKREYPDAHFLGALSGEKLAGHYAAADLFEFPSIADTFGLVLLEACAAGLRVAAMPAPGPSDIFADDTAKDFVANRLWCWVKPSSIALLGSDAGFRRRVRRATRTGAPLAVLTRIRL